MNGLCKEGANCQYSHGLSKKAEAMMRSDYQGAREDCCRGEHKVTPAEPKLCPPASQGLPPRAEALGEGSPGTVKAPNAGCTAVGAAVDDWVYAVEFIPGKPYYGRFAHTCAGALQQGPVTEERLRTGPVGEEPKKPSGDECPLKSEGLYFPEESCDLCGLKVPNAEDATQRLKHLKSCIEAHEKDMELAFAVQRSRHLVCGICMEVIYEKTNPNEVRFGILSNCNHTFCLKCIRKWRSAKQFESKIIKACPECRVTSNFVIPSEFWVEEHEEKQRLIQKYKEAMSNKPCRYFDGGRGNCPFGSNCFYKHAPTEVSKEEPQKATRAI